MKVVGLGRLDDFKQKHRDATSQLDAWVREATNAKWRTPQDIKARYAHASILPGNRVVFNIKGNRYRLDTKVNYATQVVLVVRVGTHADYDDWSF
jgi:mRNA interferase HigB